MFITGLGRAAPIHRYEQAQCWAALQGSERFALLTPRSRAILRKVLTGNNGIRTRHLALEQLGHEPSVISTRTLAARMGVSLIPSELRPAPSSARIKA